MSDDQGKPTADAPNPAIEGDKKPQRGRPENLRPAKKGEIRNPKGINGASRRARFMDWADEALPGDKDGRTRAEAVRDAVLRKALKGSDNAQKLFTEQYQGRAPQSLELSGPDGGPVEVGPALTSDERRRRVAELEEAARERAARVAVAAAGDEPDGG